jgi:hypothetical protein
MWRQRPLHVAFTAQQPVAHQPQGLIGLKSVSMPQHEMLADAGESGQNAKIFPTREISTSSMQTATRVTSGRLVPPTNGCYKVSWPAFDAAATNPNAFE